jgi:hypothetical protein
MRELSPERADDPPGAHWRREWMQRLLDAIIATLHMIDAGADTHFSQGMAWSIDL